MPKKRQFLTVCLRDENFLRAISLSMPSICGLFHCRALIDGTIRFPPFCSIANGLSVGTLSTYVVLSLLCVVGLTCSRIGPLPHANHAASPIRLQNNMCSPFPFMPQKQCFFNSANFMPNIPKFTPIYGISPLRAMQKCCLSTVFYGSAYFVEEIGDNNITGQTKLQ